jgi:predicted deacetylase
MPVIISIHDVMPETLSAVENILALLAHHRIGTKTLLVVPGKNWSQTSLAYLRSWLSNGAVLAGHGWRHRCGVPQNLWHQLHSRLFSRDVAEHLALFRPQILALIRRCHRWFAENGLPRPALYVPPAWAMGNVRRQDLCRLPFWAFETLSGIFEIRRKRFVPLPLVGFEADTLSRATALKGFNAVNLAWARRSGLPLRVAIHPFDLHHRLSDDLRRLLSGSIRSAGYEKAFHRLLRD